MKTVLHSFLKETGLSQRATSKVFDVSQSSVNGWSVGRSPLPKPMEHLLTNALTQINLLNDQDAILVDSPGGSKMFTPVEFLESFGYAEFMISFYESING